MANYNTTTKLLRDKAYKAISAYVNFEREYQRKNALSAFRALQREGYTVTQIISLLHEAGQELSKAKFYKEFPEIKK